VIIDRPINTRAETSRCNPRPPLARTLPSSSLACRGQERRATRMRGPFWRRCVNKNPDSRDGARPGRAIFGFETRTCEFVSHLPRFAFDTPREKGPRGATSSILGESGDLPLGNPLLESSRGDENANAKRRERKRERMFPSDRSAGSSPFRARSSEIDYPIEVSRESPSRVHPFRGTAELPRLRARAPQARVIELTFNYL